MGEGDAMAAKGDGLVDSPKRKSRLGFYLVSSAILGCLAFAVFAVATFASVHLDAIVQETDTVLADNDIASKLQQGYREKESEGYLANLIKTSLPDNMRTVTMGTPVTLDGVYFQVLPSKAVIHDPEAVASIDFVITNNSDKPLNVPHDTGFEALSKKGSTLNYNWHEEGVGPGANHDHMVYPGETHYTTLTFTDDHGRVADAILVSLKLSRPLNDTYGIYWFVE